MIRITVTVEDTENGAREMDSIQIDMARFEQFQQRLEGWGAPNFLLCKAEEAMDKCIVDGTGYDPNAV